MILLATMQRDAAILDFAEEHVTRMFAAAKGYGYPIVDYHPFLSFLARGRASAEYSTVNQQPPWLS